MESFEVNYSAIEKVLGSSKISYLVQQICTHTVRTYISTNTYIHKYIYTFIPDHLIMFVFISYRNTFAHNVTTDFIPTNSSELRTSVISS